MLPGFLFCFLGARRVFQSVIFLLHCCMVRSKRIATGFHLEKFAEGFHRFGIFVEEPEDEAEQEQEGDVEDV